MRRLLTALVLLTLAACGGEATGVDALPDGPLALALVSGDSQQVAVTDTLPFDAVTQVMKGGQPMADQLVDWAVTADNCGTPFVSTTRTDSVGTTGNRAVAGTRAWTRPDTENFCRMEVRWALTQGDSVIARVDTAFHYLVLPGDLTSDFGGLIFQGYGSDTIVHRTEDYAKDQYGNVGAYWLEPDCCAHTTDTVPGSVGARTLVFDSAGTGEVVIMAGDSVLDRAILTTTDSAQGVRTDFRNH